MNVEYTKVSCYKLVFDGCTDDIADAFNINHKRNTIDNNELYFKTQEDAKRYVQALCERIKDKGFKASNGVAYSHIFNPYTRKEDDYTFHDNKLYIQINSDEFTPKYCTGLTHYIGFIASIYYKEFTFVE